MRRAMTLLESLLALVMLGAVALAVASLVSTATRGLAPVTAERKWELAGREALRCIHDDLAIGDEEARKAWLEEGAFVIRTRASGDGQVVHNVKYHHDPARGTLTRLVGTSGKEGSVPMLGSVAGFTASLNSQGMWTVSIRSLGGVSLTGRFAP